MSEKTEDLLIEIEIFFQVQDNDYLCWNKQGFGFAMVLQKLELI